MSDRTFPHPEPEEKPWADALVDSLLEQSATGGDDESFLASVEAAIDSETGTPKRPYLLERKLWLLSGSIAAVLVVGLTAILYGIRTRTPVTPSQMVEKTTFTVETVNEPEPTQSRSIMAADGVLKNAESATTLSRRDSGATEPKDNSSSIASFSGIESKFVAKTGESATGVAIRPSRSNEEDSGFEIHGVRDSFIHFQSPDSPDPYKIEDLGTYAGFDVTLGVPGEVGLVADTGSLAPADSTRQVPAKKGGDWGLAPVPKAPVEETYDLGEGISAGYDTDYVFYGRKFRRAQSPTGATTRSGDEETKFGYSYSASEQSRIVIPVKPSTAESHTSRYGKLTDNEWASPLKDPLSTFSIDVDTASWANVRGMIRSGVAANQIPDDSVRIEELINYFDWSYPQPDGDHPFAASVETAICPWESDHRLMRIGIQGKSIDRRDRPAANLVFLLDVSGSMNQPNKLPLVKRSIANLVEELNAGDRVSMAVYAGSEGVALNPTIGSNQQAILKALDNLNASGSTNGGAGIKLAYRLARDQFIEKGINRVILCTDGDFNVGVTGNEELVTLVEKGADDDIFLSVCGFGQDNFNDSMLEQITNKGNGNYYFIDSLREGRKVFLEDLMGTLVTIAKDVKIQIEFNPAEVAGYRLIGYANRKLEAEDFDNDEVDAGEVGSGHSVTALYEIVPAGAEKNPAMENLRYQKAPAPEPVREIVSSPELALLKLRYKKPDEDTSLLMEQPIMPSDKSWKKASNDYRFAAAVGLFGMILRENQSVAGSTLEDVVKVANVEQQNADKSEFIELVKQLIDSE